MRKSFSPLFFNEFSVIEPFTKIFDAEIFNAKNEHKFVFRPKMDVARL